MTYAQRLRNSMQSAKITQTELSLRSGIGKPSISQYLTGKNKPGRKYSGALAEVLEVDEKWLYGDEVEEFDNFPSKITLPEAARCMHKSVAFIQQGLKQGKLTFGDAIKFPTSSKYSYYISPEKFRAYVGVEVFNKFFGLEKKHG